MESIRRHVILNDQAAALIQFNTILTSLSRSNISFSRMLYVFAESNFTIIVMQEFGKSDDSANLQWKTA